MHPLLSREEINALLHETGEPLKELPCQLTIEAEKPYIVLKDLFDLDQDAVIEINLYLDRPYEIRNKGKVVAYGLLVVLDSRLVLRITRLIDRNDSGLMA